MFLFDALRAFIRSRRLGKALFAPLRLRLRRGWIREPDILFVFNENFGRTQNKYWKWADLVMEIVSPDADSNERDYEKKRRYYAAAGIPEYWIADPQERRITALAIDGGAYREHGVFTPGQRASSALLPGFEVDVTDAFNAADQASQPAR